ncbi:brachyurin-like isoform X2 [Daphnia pulicaria]|nr:brachyurin-like isoform X2 [Daphnia pulicaria]
METKPNEFPWMVYLRVKFWSGDSAQCGGTLISDRWILTAAHCLYGVVDVTAILGAHDVTNSNSLPRQEFSTKKWNIHPLWSYGQVENDVALVQLPVAAVMSDYARPACLPYSDDPNFVDFDVTITGWGNYSSAIDSGTSPVLRSVRSSVIDSSGTTGICQQKASGEGVGPFHGDKIICSDSSYNRHFCHGDDGGPMNLYNSYWNTYTVVGVAWIGDTSCSISTKPNICARVSYFIDWIHDTTGIPRIPRPTTTTTTTTPAPTTSYFTCEGKPSGIYPNPACDCCTTFYKCSNGYAYLYDCPDAGTVFDPEILVCVYPGNLPACEGSAR